MGLLTFKGGIHPKDGKALAKDQPIKELLPLGELVYPLSQKDRRLRKQADLYLRRFTHPWQEL